MVSAYYSFVICKTLAIHTEYCKWSIKGYYIVILEMKLVGRYVINMQELFCTISNTLKTMTMLYSTYIYPQILNLNKRAIFSYLWITKNVSLVATKRLDQL